MHYYYSDFSLRFHHEHRHSADRDFIRKPVLGSNVHSVWSLWCSSGCPSVRPTLHVKKKLCKHISTWNRVCDHISMFDLGVAICRVRKYNTIIHRHLAPKSNDDVTIKGTGWQWRTRAYKYYYDTSSESCGLSLKIIIYISWWKKTAEERVLCRCFESLHWLDSGWAQDTEYSRFVIRNDYRDLQYRGHVFEDISLQRYYSYSFTDKFVSRNNFHMKYYRSKSISTYIYIYIVGIGQPVAKLWKNETYLVGLV